MPWRSYLIVCENADCYEHEYITKDAIPIGGALTCDCGAPAVRIPQPTAAIGIMVEHVDPQSGRVFNSNRDLKHFMKQGEPILDGDGTILGYKELREVSHAEIDQQRRAIRERQEVSAKKAGLAWADWKAKASGQSAEIWKAQDIS